MEEIPEKIPGLAKPEKIPDLESDERR